jgi:hypothetical protein
MKKIFEKPNPTTASVYNYHDVIAWIEQKYEIEVRNYMSSTSNLENQSSKLDFWFWITDNQFFDIHNGAYCSLMVSPEVIGQEEWDSQPSWVNEILSMIDKEFPEAEGELTVLVAW